jgi:hypothetical protein
LSASKKASAMGRFRRAGSSLLTNVNQRLSQFRVFDALHQTVGEIATGVFRDGHCGFQDRLDFD